MQNRAHESGAEAVPWLRTAAVKVISVPAVKLPAGERESPTGIRSALPADGLVASFTVNVIEAQLLLIVLSGTGGLPVFTQKYAVCVPAVAFHARVYVSEI